MEDGQMKREGWKGHFHRLFLVPFDGWNFPSLDTRCVNVERETEHNGADEYEEDSFSHTLLDRRGGEGC